MMKALEEISDCVQELVLGFDTTGNIIFANKKARKELGYLGTGMTKEEGVDLNISQIFPIYFDGQNTLEEKTKQKPNAVTSAIAYRKNQTCFPAELKFTKLEDEETFYCCSLFNVINQKETRKKLERAEAEIKTSENVRNEFVANVTHELRTPVNGIIGHVKYLEEKGDLTAEQTETMKIIERCCDNMAKIINNLLDFSKIEAGKFTLDIAPFRFRDCIKHVIETNIKQANEKGISLESRIAESIPDELIGDELRISQILNNLLSNAIKFTAIGQVRLEIVEVAHYGNEIELFFMVIDSGIGIKKEDMDKLFQSFSQVDGSITRKYGGTGLGLAVTKDLVEMMKGSINVESRPGKGSTFAFSIILTTTERAPEKEVSLEEVEKIKVKPDLNKILMASDQLDMDAIYQYGTKENLKELKTNMEKLVLCIEMRTWERAEEFSGNIKKLLEKAGTDFTKQAFRLEMCVRKEDYEKSMDSYNKLKELLQL